VRRCPDSATCKAVPDSRGRCPFHAEHAADREAYGDAEDDIRRLPQDGD
jgi:hypothetical protein